MSRSKNTTLPIIVLSILILVTSLLSIRTVYAAGRSLVQTSQNWDNYENSLEGNAEETYPYNSTSTATITSVSMDILYGVTRGLVVYHGELPYEQIYTDEDEIIDRWEGYYAEPDTSAKSGGSNPSYGASESPSAVAFWGFDSSTQPALFNADDNFENVPTIEQLNATSVVSLRLYAMANTKTGFGVWIGNLLYTVTKFVAWVAVFIISLIVKAKNLDMNTIMSILNLNDLGEMMTKNFIWDGSTVKLSAFTAFCILAFIFSLAAYAIRWVKGADKTTGLWEIIGTALVALLIIGMCLTGRISSLGSSISSLASNVMYSVVNSMSYSGLGKAFEINVTDAEHENEVTQMCEMALINHAFIDLQLCVQFNVPNVNKLEFINLGDDVNFSNAKKYLSGVDSADMSADFNKNLGYYYWFANSSAVSKTSKNTTVPDTDAVSVTNKLSSMITYLQVMYNKAVSDGNTARQKVIKNIIIGFSNPRTGVGFFTMLLFTLALGLMAIVLLRYALNVVIAKLELFVSLLGMVIAGPLMLTTNKKLVQTGKMILGMLVVSFIELTVYSVIFDIIIYVVSSMFSPNIPSLIAVCAMLILLLKFNSIIAYKIKQLLERTERTISPALSDGKRAIKNYAKNKSSEFNQFFDRSRATKGYKADGTPIEEERAGNALSRLLHHGHNALFNEGNEHQGFFKINAEMNAKRNAAKSNTALLKRTAAEQNVQKELDEIDSEARVIEERIKADIKKTVDATREKDASGKETGKYDLDHLSDVEKEHAKRLSELDVELDELKSSERYKQLQEEKLRIDEENSKKAVGEELLQMNEEHAKELESFRHKIATKKMNIDSEKKKIEESIKQRASKNAYLKQGLDYDSMQGNDETENLHEAAVMKAQDKHKDNLEEVLKNSIATVTKEVNDTSNKSKIGNKNKTSKVNIDAATSQAAAMLQLNQLQNGEMVSKTADAKNDVKDIVDNVVRHYEGTDAHTTSKQDVEAKRNKYTNSRAFSEERKEAKQDYIDAKNQYREEVKNNKEAAKEQYNTAREEMGGGVVIDKVTVTEQLQSGINNRPKKSKQTKERPNPYNNNKADMSQVINTHENIPPQPPQSPQQQRQAQQPQPQHQQQQRQTQQTASQANNQRSQNSRQETRQSQPTRQERSEFNQQNMSREMNNMQNAIHNQEEEVRTNNRVEKPIPTHNRTDTKKHYENDEARRVARQQDEKFWE